MSWTVFILNILGNLSGKYVEIARHGSAWGKISSVLWATTSYLLDSEGTY